MLRLYLELRMLDGRGILVRQVLNAAGAAALDAVDAVEAAGVGLVDLADADDLMVAGKQIEANARLTRLDYELSHVPSSFVYSAAPRQLCAR